MIFKSSAVWTMSSDDLIEHLHSLEAPDQVYWDSRSLKKEGKKFQSLDWAHWPKPIKIDGEWKFAEPEPAPARVAPTLVIAPPAVAPVAPRPVTPPPPAKIAPAENVVAALETVSSEVLDRWVRDGCPHPAPEAILLAKQKSGGGWTAVMRAARTIVGGAENPPAAPVSVADRIEQAPACEVINLTESEKIVYRGAGWRLARFEAGQMVELFDPSDLPFREDRAEQFAAALDAALAWTADRQTGEIWLVMCSCYVLCDPRRISLDDPASVEHLAAALSDEVNNFFD